MASGPGSRNVAALIERAKSDGRRVARQSGERDPRVGRSRKTRDRTHFQVVVGAEEGAETESLGLQRDGQEVIVSGALLGLGEHS